MPTPGKSREEMLSEWQAARTHSSLPSASKRAAAAARSSPFKGSPARRVPRGRTEALKSYGTPTRVPMTTAAAAGSPASPASGGCSGDDELAAEDEEERRSALDSRLEEAMAAARSAVGMNRSATQVRPPSPCCVCTLLAAAR